LVLADKHQISELELGELDVPALGLVGLYSGLFEANVVVEAADSPDPRKAPRRAF
jgi:hypothetical protein